MQVSNFSLLNTCIGRLQLHQRVDAGVHIKFYCFVVCACNLKILLTSKTNWDKLLDYFLNLLDLQSRSCSTIMRNCMLVTTGTNGLKTLENERFNKQSFSYGRSVWCQTQELLLSMVGVKSHCNHIS